MSEKTKYNIWVPDKTAENFLDLEEFIDQLLLFYAYIAKVDFNKLELSTNLERQVDRTTEEYSKICQEYGKLRQEYGVVNFSGNELFTRNTVTGLKLGLLMSKLNRSKNLWGDNFSLDYEGAKELIKHFSDRYLLKRDEE